MSLGSEYAACWTLDERTCDGRFKVGVEKGKMDFEACKRYCNADSHCKFIFHIPSLVLKDQFNCIKYQSCEEIRTAAFAGTTYSKDSNCPGILLLCTISIHM